MSAWYEQSFGRDYMQLYAHRDLAEACANISATERLINPPKDEPLLDLCCGWGRCLAALWRSGHRRLVGLDLSTDLLSAAAQTLRREGAPDVVLAEAGGEPPPAPTQDRVVLVRGDMRHIPYQGYFATVLSIFTSFGYFDADEQNAAVLLAIHQALRPGGVMLMDYLNADWVRGNLVPEDEQRLADRVVHNRRRISDDGRRVEKVTTVTPTDGKPHRLGESVRLYSEPEMQGMLAGAGFVNVRSLGSLAGERYSPDSQRLVLVAGKDAKC